MAFALAIAGFLSNKINPLRTIYIFSAASAATVVLLLLFQGSAFSIILLFPVAISIALGQLAVFVYFWKTTVQEERARTGGLVALITLPFYFGAIVVAPSLDFEGIILLSAVFMSITFGAALLKPGRALRNIKSGTENIPEKRTILLYSIPWVVFSLVNVTLARNTSLGISQQVSSSFYTSLVLVQLFATLAGVLTGGFVADFLGRRLALAISLTLYGLSSALPGLFNNQLAFAGAYIANGIGWGFLLVLYTFVIWGDLSNNSNSAKMYSIGLIIFYVSIGVGFLTTNAFEVPLILSSLASCLVIFISNIPIILAQEPSSSDFRERMKLKMHLNTIKKVKRQSEH
jgi:predicted MFS family arabinose efflux permease